MPVLTKPLFSMLERSLAKQDWPLLTLGEIPVVRSPLLSRQPQLCHAFTTRQGGKSEAPLDSFNLGRHWPTEESRADAMVNRRSLCEALGLEAGELVVPGQKHTTNIYWAKSGSHTFEELQAVDAVATTKLMQPVLLHYADCVPVMIVDTKKPAICVIHAGWRGTAGGIVSKAVVALCERTGSRAQDLIAAVGPAIGSCCYQTGEEVVAQLSLTVKDAEPLIQRRQGDPYPDLKAFNAMQLLQAGVSEVDVTAWCTACHPEIFYSHRQSQGQTGRQGALACLLAG